MSVEAYPLQWPQGRPRTANRERPKFSVNSFTAARDGLFNELKLLKASSTVLSTNVELRRDGLPYAGRAQPVDPGVAVYFVRNGRQVCFACDRWIKVEHNMRAIADAIECIRMIERRGTGEMTDAAFEGFKALPAATSDPWAKEPWFRVLGVPQFANTEDVIAAYRKKMLDHHPDRGGNPEVYHAIDRAYGQFKLERGLT